MRILGISAFYHDSAAALVEDGRIVAAAQEERFTRKKHDASFPHHAIAYCLGAAGAKLSEIDHIAFYDKPFLKFERLLETYVALAPAGFRSFQMAIPLWLKFGLLLHKIVNPVIMALLFYGTVLPTGLIARAMGKDLLRLKREPDAESYWIVRTPAGPAPETMKDQF